MIDALAQSSLSLAIQEKLWLIPAVQSVHILALALLFFAALSANIAMLRGASASDAPWLLTAQRWTFGPLLLLAMSGAVLIIGEPARSLPNAVFQIKMALLALAVIVTLLIQRDLRCGKAAGGPVLPVVSILLWTAILICGRLIAYIGGHP